MLKTPYPPPKPLVRGLGQNAVETYNDIKNKLLDINRDVRLVIQQASSIEGLAFQSLNGWHSTTTRIERQLSEDSIRVALVGSIMSGKS